VGRSPSRQRFDGAAFLRPSQHEEQVGKPVGVAHHLRVAQLTRLLQADDPSLGAAHHGAGDVEGRGRRCTTGDDERIR
jgi:hypothetical protein